MDLEKHLRVPKSGFELGDCDTGDELGLKKADSEPCLLYTSDAADE